MFGGLKKSASRLAIVAAAGVLSTGAYAADLGGDCCADLEERVAELEATTARKGNRKVSLTISGQVNRAIMYWNDGGRSNTYFGLDNSNSSTRFGFSGSAKISPAVSAGFSILLDVRDKGRSALVNQTTEDGSSQERSGNANGDNLVRLRDANWWLEHSSVGRLTVGRLTQAGGLGTIDLGGVGPVAVGGEGCLGQGMAFRDAAGTLTGISIATLSMGCAHTAFRTEGVRWNSPTFAGFSLAAGIGEAMKVERAVENGAANASTGVGPIGRNYGVDLKYAGEFSGVRVAAGVGYERSDANEDDGVSANSTYKNLGGVLSLLHVPTGLFVQGEYQATKGQSASALAGAALTGAEAKGDRWHVQAGIGQNWFGIGKTTLFAEYGKHNGWQGLQAAVTVAGKSVDSLTIWGLGINQAIDAAAMDLYIGYRNYDGRDQVEALGGIALQNISIITAGARIRF